MSKPDLDISDATVRRAVVIVASLNLAYFGVEFTVALAIHSVSLFADSVDFLEDAAVNFLIFVALAWTATRRATIGKLLAIILVIPGLAFLWALWNKLQHPLPPEPLQLGITGVGALIVNLICAAVLVRYRHQRGSLTKAAFLSARNDAYANLAIIAAGVLTAFFPSVWPDVVVGLGIAFMNADAAREVWQAAHQEALRAKA
ncbi:MAG: cation transporter [Povalibacter sp.]